VPIIEPEILLDGEYTIDECAEVFVKVWAAVFKACADFGVALGASLLKPSMVTPGAQSGQSADPETVARYTKAALKRAVRLQYLESCFCLEGSQKWRPR